MAVRPMSIACQFRKVPGCGHLPQLVGLGIEKGELDGRTQRAVLQNIVRLLISCMHLREWSQGLTEMVVKVSRSL